MTKWTDGPWWYSEEDNAVYEKKANVIVVYEKGLQFKNDGHLIAAAPELYEACKAAQTAIFHKDDCPCDLCGTIRTALAKARGEQ